MKHYANLLRHFLKPVILLGNKCEEALTKRNNGAYVTVTNTKGYLHKAQPVDVASLGRKGDSRPISGKNAQPFFDDLEQVVTCLKEVDGLEEYLHEQVSKAGKSFSWAGTERLIEGSRASFDRYMAQYASDQAEENGKPAPKPKAIEPEEEDILGY